jgi:hypothetical protein
MYRTLNPCFTVVLVLTGLKHYLHIFTTALAAICSAVCSDGVSPYQTSRYHFSLSAMDVMTGGVIEQVKQNDNNAVKPFANFNAVQ